MKKVLVAGLFAVSGIAFAQSGAERELQKAINQVGESCPQVTQVFRSGSHNGQLMFSVACSGGQTYFVKVDQSGSGKVLPCSTMERIGLRCFVKL